MLGFARSLSVKAKAISASSGVGRTLLPSLSSSSSSSSSSSVHLPLQHKRWESTKSDKVVYEENGFESTTIADILKAKGEKADGSWLFCKTDDTVYDAVKHVSLDPNFYGFPWIKSVFSLFSHLNSCIIC